MTIEEKIKAIAELDGWRCEESIHPRFKCRIVHWFKRFYGLEHNETKVSTSKLPHYTTDRNAIVPVIEKFLYSADEEQNIRFVEAIPKKYFQVHGYAGWIIVTATELSDALLIAISKQPIIKQK